MRRTGAHYPPPPPPSRTELRARLALLVEGFERIPESDAPAYRHARGLLGGAVDAVCRYEAGGPGLDAEPLLRLAHGAIAHAAVESGGPLAAPRVPEWAQAWGSSIDPRWGCDKLTHAQLVANPPRFNALTRLVGYQLGDHGEWLEVSNCVGCNSTFYALTGVRAREGVTG